MAKKESESATVAGKIDVQQIKRKHQIDEAAQAREIEERKRVKRQKREERNKLRAEGKPTKKKHLAALLPDGGKDADEPEAVVCGIDASEQEHKPAKQQPPVKPAKAAPQAKTKKSATSKNDAEDIDAAKLALSYLNEWKVSRSTWKFQKVRQTFLLHHMYDPYKIQKEDFKTLLEYVGTLQGRSRTVTAQEAENVLKQMDAEDTTADASDPDAEAAKALKKIKIYRAKKVSQILADVQ